MDHRTMALLDNLLKGSYYDNSILQIPKYEMIMLPI
jgi:hypothetical protein